MFDGSIDNGNCRDHGISLLYKLWIAVPMKVDTAFNTFHIGEFKDERKAPTGKFVLILR
jgi:hypothetical protein